MIKWFRSRPRKLRRPDFPGGFGWPPVHEGPRLDVVLVDQFPDKAKQGKLYLSLPSFSTLHLCPCKCGRDAIAPIGRWELTFHGREEVRGKLGGVTLHPFHPQPPVRFALFHPAQPGCLATAYSLTSKLLG